jgi:hypothetical protein
MIIDWKQIRGCLEIDENFWLTGFAAIGDSLRFHRIVVRRLKHTRDEKGNDTSGDSHDDCWRSWWKKDTSYALGHVLTLLPGNWLFHRHYNIPIQARMQEWGNEEQTVWRFR